MKKNIIILSGGFDPVHKGHIRMFKEAKKIGEVFVATEDREIIPKISVEDLEIKLKKAVEKEDYEKAAKLRDKIKDLES